MNRKFDKLGRLVIPKEMRDKLGLGEPGSEAKIELVDNKIIVTNPKQEDKFEEWLKEKDTQGYEKLYLEDILLKYIELKK